MTKKLIGLKTSIFKVKQCRTRAFFLSFEITSIIETSKILKNLSASRKKTIPTLIFKELTNAINQVYGKYSLPKVDLRRTYLRAFYYWETCCLLNKGSMAFEQSARNISAWLKDEVRISEIFSQPIGSRANYAIVRDITQGHRINEIFEYAKANLKTTKMSRGAFSRYNKELTNETELLLIRMAQIEEKKSTSDNQRIGAILCNTVLRKSIEEYCTLPYKLQTSNLKRKWIRLSKLWGGTYGAYGILRYLGITGKEARKMGISEPEAIKGSNKVYVGEALLYFDNEQFSTLEPLKGARKPVSAYQINLLFGEKIMGEWAYNRFDGYSSFTIKDLFAGPAISDQIHIALSLHAKPETFIMLTMHPKYGAAIFGFKKGTSTEEIMSAFKQIEEGNTLSLIRIANILSADRILDSVSGERELLTGDVLNVQPYTRHTVGAVETLDKEDQLWVKEIINKGIVGMLEIAANQFAVSRTWVDPATKRMFDGWVERAKKLLGLAVEHRHMDLKEVAGYVDKLVTATPKSAKTQPVKIISYKDAAGKVYPIGKHYDFRILNFEKAGAEVNISDFGHAQAVIVALGTNALKRERIEVVITSDEGVLDQKYTLFRGEGLRIPAVFKGKIKVTSLDKDAWLVWVTVPESKLEPITDDDLFIRKKL